MELLSNTLIIEPIIRGEIQSWIGENGWWSRTFEGPSIENRKTN